MIQDSSLSLLRLRKLRPRTVSSPENLHLRRRQTCWKRPEQNSLCSIDEDPTLRGSQAPIFSLEPLESTSSLVLFRVVG